MTPVEEQPRTRPKRVLPGDYHSARGDVKRLIRQKASAATGRPMSNKAAKKWLKRQIRAKGGEGLA